MLSYSSCTLFQEDVLKSWFDAIRCNRFHFNKNPCAQSFNQIIKTPRKSIFNSKLVHLGIASSL